MNNLDCLETPYTPLNLIKAGAGAGKTYHIQKTLTEWVKSGKISADRILAVTFTNAAANEMKERIRLELLQSGLHQESTQVQQSTISTIHAFGLEIIERFAYEKGSSPCPRQLTEAEENILIRLSLTEVEKIATILNDLSGWGYTGKFNGNEYIDAVVLFKNRVLQIIRKLRDLGITDSLEDIQILISNAKRSLSKVYGLNLQKAGTLNKTLWNAIKEIQDIYTESELDNEWGSNKETRVFVKTIFSVTEQSVKSDWKLWTKLQSIGTAPRIFNKKTGELIHDDGKLAQNVWDVADQLTYHPGPLAQAHEHIEILLESAGETLLQYQQRKNSAGLVDFGDMVHLAEKLMQDERWLTEVKSKYDCLIIDEFQDTNPLQFALTQGITKAGIPTLIVGDIKQSIMGFQGADSRLFGSLINQKQKNTSELKNNWRSSSPLMGFINKLGDVLYGDKYTALKPQSNIQSSLVPVKIIEFSLDSWSERGTKIKNNFGSEHNNVVVAEIKKLLDSKVLITDKLSRQQRRIRPNDIAILGPSHKGLGQLANVLREFGLQPQLTEPGWFASNAVTWLLYALSYLADPRDQHALMCLKLLKEKQTTLQSELQDYISQNKNKKVSGSLVDSLDSVRKGARFLSVKDTIWQTIDAMGLWEIFGALGSENSNGQQQRANLLKLIDLAQVFEDTQNETLEAQGIYGKGLSSFTIWLQENSDEFDKQPHVNPDNENAVVLKTWHSSKGLEWPVVVVVGMDKDRQPKIPSISVQYKDNANADDMLASAYTQIFTEFDNKETKEKFIDNLLPAEKDNLRNLTYVVMTRAREQLILPWFDSNKDNCMVGLLNKMDMQSIKGVNVQPAITPNQPDVEANRDEQVIDYGRVALEYTDCDVAIPEQVTPSQISHSIKSKNYTVLKSVDYSEFIDLSTLDKDYAAHDLGTLVHSIYQVMVYSSAMQNRLFANFKEFDSDLKNQLIAHVKLFEDWLVVYLKAISWDAEVPMLAKTKNGETLSGIIDLLVESDEGYWIIDHKTDTNTDDESAKKHLPQLLAYAENLKLDKPIIGVAVNWVREGRVSILEMVF